MDMQRAAAAALLSAALGAACPAQAQFPPKIPRAQLDAMFENMREKSHWNVDGPLLWGYFFLDTDRKKLADAGAELAKQGYRVVGVESVDGKPVSRLHVERVEVHSPATLDARDIELEAFARAHHIASYDGMDVGPAP